MEKSETKIWAQKKQIKKINGRERLMIWLISIPT